MKIINRNIVYIILAFCLVQITTGQDGLKDQRWSESKINSWYENLEPLKGFNFLPSTAVNSTEMWQGDTFDASTIQKELKMAHEAGYNSARVFLQYLVWKDNPAALKTRIDEFLTIAHNNNISVMFILFDDCAFAGKEPYLGVQDDPVPGVHNSGWTPSPGKARATDTSYWPDLEKYVKDIVYTYKDDKRIIVWDLYNEPGNSQMWEKSLPLLKSSFQWAREVAPSQPLTTAPWGDFYNIFSNKSLLTKEILEMSDIISFHAYEKPCEIENKIQVLKLNYKRPVICTEWLRRQNGGTFENLLPLFSNEEIGWYQWGLVAGDTQTYMHWGSKKGSPEPKIWQHDVFHKNGKAYEPSELKLVSEFKFMNSNDTKK